MRNTTVTDNSTDESGGGIFLFSDGTAQLTHTIVAGNGNSSEAEVPGPSDCAAEPGGMIISLGQNLFGAGTGCPSDGPGDQVVDPATVFTDVLDRLQDNGGPTETHAQLPGSPASDAGEAVCTDANGVPLTTDQRGLPRPVDGNSDSIADCDIGAVEFQP